MEKHTNKTPEVLGIGPGDLSEIAPTEDKKHIRARVIDVDKIVWGFKKPSGRFFVFDPSWHGRVWLLPGEFELADSEESLERYKVIDQDESNAVDIESMLNNMFVDGWELIQTVPMWHTFLPSSTQTKGTDAFCCQCRYIFKRRA